MIRRMSEIAIASAGAAMLMTSTAALAGRTPTDPIGAAPSLTEIHRSGEPAWYGILESIVPAYVEGQRQRRQQQLINHGMSVEVARWKISAGSNPHFYAELARGLAEAKRGKRKEDILEAVMATRRELQRARNRANQVEHINSWAKDATVGALSLVPVGAAAVPAKLAPIVAAALNSEIRGIAVNRLWPKADIDETESAFEQLAAARHPGEAQKTILSAVFAEMADNPNLDAALSDLVTEELGFHPSDRPEDIMDAAPALKKFSELATELKGQDNSNEKIAEAISSIKNETAELEAAFEKSMAEARTEAERERLRQNWQERQRIRLDGTRAGIRIASMITNAADPDLGQRFGTVGEATIDIIETTNEFRQALSKHQDLVGFLAASAALDYAYIGMTVLGAFIDTGPTMDELILKQLHDINDQLEVMSGKLDGIDDSIRDLHEELRLGFDEVINMLTNDRKMFAQNFKSIRSDFAEIAARLDEIELRFVAGIEQVKTLVIDLQIARCTDRDVSESFNMDEGTFADCTARFHALFEHLHDLEASKQFRKATATYTGNNQRLIDPDVMIHFIDQYRRFIDTNSEHAWRLPPDSDFERQVTAMLERLDQILETVAGDYTERTKDLIASMQQAAADLEEAVENVQADWPPERWSRHYFDFQSDFPADSYPAVPKNVLINSLREQQNSAERRSFCDSWREKEGLRNTYPRHKEPLELRDEELIEILQPESPVAAFLAAGRADVTICMGLRLFQEKTNESDLVKVGKSKRKTFTYSDNFQFWFYVVLEASCFGERLETSLPKSISHEYAVTAIDKNGSGFLNPLRIPHDATVKWIDLENWLVLRERAVAAAKNWFIARGKRLQSAHCAADYTRHFREARTAYIADVFEPNPQVVEAVKQYNAAAAQANEALRNVLSFVFRGDIGQSVTLDALAAGAVAFPQVDTTADLLSAAHMVRDAVDRMEQYLLSTEMLRIADGGSSFVQPAGAAPARQPDRYPVLAGLLEPLWAWLRR